MSESDSSCDTTKPSVIARVLLANVCCRDSHYHTRSVNFKSREECTAMGHHLLIMLSVLFLAIICTSALAQGACTNASFPKDLSGIECFGLTGVAVVYHAHDSRGLSFLFA